MQEDIEIMDKSFLEKNVSLYGATNKEECIAECFARYIGWKLGIDDPPTDFILAVIE